MKTRRSGMKTINGVGVFINGDVVFINSGAVFINGSAVYSFHTTASGLAAAFSKNLCLLQEAFQIICCIFADGHTPNKLINPC